MPGPDEVLLQVKASCICRSDLSLYYGNAVVGGDAAGGCITGHEPAGVVIEAGIAVKNFKPGDRVAVYLAVGCGVCARCRQGNFHLCAQWKCLGFTQDGGNAEHKEIEILGGASDNHANRDFLGRNAGLAPVVVRRGRDGYARGRRRLMSTA